MSQPAQSLSEWIVIATAGLPPSAVSKVSAEIADHAVESRQKHVAEGMSPGEADAAVVADLGDAGQVARTFRDAHFSRAEYTRGWAALLAQTGIGLAAIVFNGLAASTVGRSLFDDLAWITLCANALSGSLLSIMALRALLTFLREQFDMEAPKWGRRLVIGGLLAQMPWALWISLLVWADTYSQGRLPVLEALLERYVFDMVVVLVTVVAATQIMIGALTIGLFRKHLASMSLRGKPLRSAAILLIGAAGLALVMIGLSIVVQLYNQELSAIPAVTTVTGGVSILVAGLTVLVLGVFAYMSRPGAALIHS